MITVRGAQLLAKADIVFYDALVLPEMLNYCANAQKVLVGKRCGKFSTAQRFIEKRMIDAAQKYPCVVRLKGGDPMMFGRADEELRALESAGILVEVVPGVTAALAAAASLQKSLTLRGVSRSVAFVTNARGHDEKQSDLPIKQPQADTLVYYMGRKEAHQIGYDLISQGKKPETPVVVIQGISTPEERSISLSLHEMAQGQLDTWFVDDLPALLIVGQAMHERLSSHVGFGKTQNRIEDIETFTDSRRSA